MTSSTLVSGVAAESDSVAGADHPQIASIAALDRKATLARTRGATA